VGEVLRRAFRRKYLSLGIGELVAAAVFLTAARHAVAPRLFSAERAALWAALLPLLVVLTQAGAYWLLARGWVLRAAMPIGLARLFRLLRVVDVGVLLAGLVGLVRWWPDRTAAAVLVVAIWLFGLLEYVNYFLTRLSYPASRWATEVTRWRTPRLVRDMRTTQRGR